MLRKRMNKFRRQIAYEGQEGIEEAVSNVDSILIYHDRGVLVIHTTAYESIEWTDIFIVTTKEGTNIMNVSDINISSGEWGGETKITFSTPVMVSRPSDTELAVIMNNEPGIISTGP